MSSSPILNSLGLSITQNLNWKFHISSLANAASSRFGVLYRFQQFFSHQLLTIYKGLVCPCMEYACPMWGGSTHTALLDRVESEAFRIIRSPPLTNSLLPLKFWRNVASLLIFYHYFPANCFSELANCMPPLLPWPHSTCLSSKAHSNTVQTTYARVNQYLFSFFPFTGKLWNSLPASVFPPVYDLNAFKKRVSRHLCNLNWSFFWLTL